jgi:hypothetical protein
MGANYTSQLRVLMTLESNNGAKLASILDHHADYVIDFDNNRDILTSVEGVQSYIVGDKTDRTKLNMLAEIINYILPDGKAPSISELDDDDATYDMYKAIESLKSHLEENGY